jgi:PAS domain S-box-containing protein
MHQHHRRPGEWALDWRSTLAILMALALLIATGVAARIALNHTQAASHRLNNTYLTLEYRQATLTSLYAAEAARRGYLINGDRSFIDEQSTALDEADRRLQALRSLCADQPEQVRRLENLESLFKRLRHSFASADQKNLAAGRAASREIAAILEDFKHTAEQDLQQQLEHSESLSWWLAWIAFFVSLLALQAGAGAVLVLNRSAAVRRSHRTDELMRANEALHRQVEDRTHAEAALERERRFLRAVLESAQDGIVACDAEGNITYFNATALEFHGRAQAPKDVREWATGYDLHGPDGKSPLTLEQLPLVEALRGEQVRDTAVIITPPGRPARTVWVSGQAITAAGGARLGAVVVLHDATERVRLEEQFLQAQKMEAVGRLAGGIAHDFNNLLTVINGSSFLLQARLPAEERNRALLDQVVKAGERAAALTRQLLAFSRKQVLQPRVLDLNALVADLEKMLRRLIGEDVTLTTVLDPATGRVQADPGQVEQLLMNLAVNARDAMPQGGRLTIQTGNSDLATSASDTHIQVPAGRYVMLAVRDTGIGMDQATKARLFEPFFTTKEVGKGTGLGLATVYGIVKQSGGTIRVQSEPGQGTTFTIYLPRVEAAPVVDNKTTGSAAPRGHETILLVEDEAEVRKLIRLTLQAQGYTVLEATSSEGALDMAQAHPGNIDVLLTDVVMPGLSGRLVAQRLQALRPSLKVIYMSGYTDDATVRHGVLQAEADFLQKPFRPDDLARKVREVLER